MIQAPNENMKNPFEDEPETEGERYIEKFQEILFSHHEPTQNLLESLKTQDKKTLEDLRNLITDLLENAENADKEKYRMVLNEIDLVMVNSEI